LKKDAKTFARLSPATRQKFFGSFFQKRIALLALVWAPRPPLFGRSMTPVQ
jgi:hypothetical protein